MRWLKVIKINSDKECMIAIFSFYYFFCICLNLINAQTKILDDEEMYFTLCLIIVSGFLSAQSVDRKIPLKKGKSRHLHANLILQNKLPVRGMIESGVPILVMDSTFVFNHLDDLNISLVESKATLNLAGNKYKCTHITNDTIFVNGLFYKGKTVIANIASKKIDIMYPIHLFGDLNDANSKIMELNISSKYMMPLTRQELELKKVNIRNTP